MRLAQCLPLLALSLTGCLLFFDGDQDTDMICELDAPASVPAPLRNPDNLTCESFGYGCDPACGPCPLVAGSKLAPLPTWGMCGSPCEALAEEACMARSECRVVKDLRCAVSGYCLTDFAGCFPTDSYVDPELECGAALDGYACSTSPSCTAFHGTEPCMIGAPDAECPRPFVLCMREGQPPGRCYDAALCRAVAPACPTGTMPGVSNACWTGACIPLDLCEIPPNW